MDRMDTKGQMIDQIDLRGVPRSGFDRSNHNYFTGKLGQIIATRIDEVYPGDRIKGKPTLVANFEPLAAPIMGSMVLKQEAFFVPYDQLWKNSWKFFTGKNGFNKNMPTVSPRRIFEIYARRLHPVTFNIENDSFVFILGVLHSMILSSAIYNYEQFELDFNTMLTEINEYLARYYSNAKMFDLASAGYKPLFNFKDTERFTYFKEHLMYATTASQTVAEWKNVCYQYAVELADMLYDAFMYYHGPSSLFDYLGWPVVPEFKKPDGVTAELITNLFDYYAYMRVFVGDTFEMNLYDEVRSYFSDVPLNFMPFKAYYLVWYWNYRDQLLETDILDPQEDEFLGDTITDNVIMYCTIIRQRCWFKDAYTTALTNTGDGNLLVPISDGSIFNSVIENLTFYNDDGILVHTTDAQSALDAGATFCQYTMNGITYKIPMNYLAGAISNNSQGTSEDGHFISLDMFDRIQRLRSVVQKRLILGYEVEDVVWSSFLVRMSNVRQHVPELLGQGRSAVQINTIVNNTSTSEQIAGDKTATAYVHGEMSDINYFSEDWGLYIQLATIMPIQSYAGGMQRLYLKKEPFDFMWPEFATMGMDAIYNVELGAFGSRLTDVQGLQVFGYQGRYYDLKYRQDEEHGRILTDLNYLTFSREFDKDNPPKLNYIFVHCWPRLDGFVIESPLTDVFRADCYTAHGWERRLPVPSQIVH